MVKMILIAVMLVFAPEWSALQAQSVPILSVEFEGNSAMETARLRGKLRNLRPGGWYHSEAAETELRYLEEAYQDEGFLRAQVGPLSVAFRTVPGKGQAAAIRIPISEGPRYTLGELTIRNANAFKPETLLRLSPIRSGEPYSRGKLGQWKERKIEEAYHTMGYLRVETRVLEEIQELRKVVNCTVEVQEGAIYRVGKITLLGDDSLSPSEFRKQLLLGEGSLYNPEMLVLSIQLLNSMRLYKPIYQSDVEIRIDDAKATVDLTFRLTPLKKGTSSSGDT